MQPLFGKLYSHFPETTILKLDAVYMAVSKLPSRLIEVFASFSKR